VRALTTALALAAVAVSCGGGDPDPITVEIGVHRVAIVVPDGWQHYDHGREHRLEISGGDIVLTDLGPVAKEGYLRVVDRARELTGGGRTEDAEEILRRLFRTPCADDPDLRSALDSVLASLSAGRSVEQRGLAFDRLRERIDLLAEPDLAALAARSLGDLDSGIRRDLELEERITLNGMQARRIQTWNSLTHENRRRFVFVVNRGHLLVIRTEGGRDEVLAPAFETVVRSIVFVGPPAQFPR
jgi:hypothetical protein